MCLPAYIPTAEGERTQKTNDILGHSVNISSFLVISTKHIWLTQSVEIFFNLWQRLGLGQKPPCSKTLQPEANGWVRGFKHVPAWCPRRPNGVSGSSACTNSGPVQSRQSATETTKDAEDTCEPRVLFSPHFTTRSTKLPIFSDIILEKSQGKGGLLLIVLVRVLQRNRTNRRCRYIPTKRFIIRNSFTRLWRLTSPETYSLQVGDPGGQMVQFQSESKGLRTRRPNGVSSSLKA